MKEILNFKGSYVTEGAKQIAARTLRSSTVRAFALALFTACNPDCTGEKKSVEPQELGESSIAEDFNGTKVQERFEREGFAGLAQELKPFSDGMDPVNRQYFDRVLDLMEANLTGVEVKRSNFEDNPKIRASASTPRDYNDPSLPKITLNENWVANNGVDLALAVHELGHVVDLLASRSALDGETWTKIYGAPGNAVEVRTELKAWELQLVLLNQLSGGLVEEFYEAVKSAQSNEEADQLLTSYTEKIAQKLNVREDQKGMLKRWLQIYFNYKAPERFGIPCRWTYDFVVQIAGEYHAQGIPMYEVDLNPGDHTNPEQCVDPLPEALYDYRSFRPYEELRPGMVGPASEAIPFNL